jgi:hypothetical protein
VGPNPFEIRVTGLILGTPKSKHSETCKCVSCRPTFMKDLLRPHLSFRFVLHTVAVTKKSISIKRCASFPSTPGELLALALSGAVLAADGGGVVSASSKISTKKSTASSHAFGRRATARGNVAIARAFAAHPQLILADDPTGSLDRSTGQKIVELLRSTTQQQATVLVVTHGEKVAQKADRRLEIEDGVLRELAESNG